MSRNGINRKWTIILLSISCVGADIFLSGILKKKWEAYAVNPEQAIQIDLTKLSKFLVIMTTEKSPKCQNNSYVKSVSRFPNKPDYYIKNK